MDLALAQADFSAVRELAIEETSRAWSCGERLRETPGRKQINVVRGMLRHWCTCVMRSKVEPMKEVAAMVRCHLEGIVARAQTRQTNGLLEALNGLFQVAKRRARGFTRMSTIRTVISLIIGKLHFRVVNPSCLSTHLKFNRASFPESGNPPARDQWRTRGRPSLSRLTVPAIIHDMHFATNPAAVHFPPGRWRTQRA